MLRKTLLLLVIVSFGGASTVAGCKAPKIDNDTDDSSQIDRGSGQEHAMGGDDHSMDRDGIKDGVTISHGKLRITNVWARPAFRGANSAVYLNLQNHGAHAESFLGATTEFATAVEIHQVTMEEDLMLMRPVLSGVEIPAEGNVEFVPGGYHLMLIDLQSDLSEDDYFPLVLQFEKSGQVLVEVLVSSP